MSESDTLVAELTARLEALEAQVEALKKHHRGVPEDVLLAITAAVSAFLGHKGKIKQVHFRGPGSWKQQARAAVQRHVITPRP